MTKIVTSPVARFPGTITLHDPLTYPQLSAWYAAMEGSAAEGLARQVDRVAVILGGVCPCVARWDLTDREAVGVQYGPENFPATPRLASTKLLAWLIGEIRKIVEAEEELPND